MNDHGLTMFFQSMTMTIHTLISNLPHNKLNAHISCSYQLIETLKERNSEEDDINTRNDVQYVPNSTTIDWNTMSYMITTILYVDQTFLYLDYTILYIAVATLTLHFSR
jgi:hypothetical protein